MTSPRSKRHRLDGGEPSDAAAEAATVSNAALTTAVRKSLAEAGEASTHAASARAEADEAAASATAVQVEAVDGMARSLAACKVAEKAAAQAVSAAVSLGQDLGISTGAAAEAGGAGEVRNPVAQESELCGPPASKVAENAAVRAVSAAVSLGKDLWNSTDDASGAGGSGEAIAALAQESQLCGPPALLNAARKDGGTAGSSTNGRGTILDLPDLIVEKIFCLLAEPSDIRGYPPVQKTEGYLSRMFPCNPALASFAFSCRRFSDLFRQSYVRTLQFNAVFRFVKEARVYLEAVSGALSRFTNIDTVSVINYDCFDRSVGLPDLLWREDGRVFKDTRDPQFCLASAEPFSIPEAVLRGISPLSRAALNVKRLRFDEDWDEDKLIKLCEVRNGLWTDSQSVTRSRSGM